MLAMRALRPNQPQSFNYEILDGLRALGLRSARHISHCSPA